MESLSRETNRILPALFAKLIGSGSLSLDTDSMSLADPRDRHYLEWLARIVAGFVLEEQNVWVKQVDEFVEKARQNQNRQQDLDSLFEKLREAAEKEDVTAEELKTLVSLYRTPLEDHYYQLEQKRNLMAALVGLSEKPEEQTPES